MRELSPEDQRLRQRIKRLEVEDACVLKLAAIAVDTKYSGFEDPRIAAIIKLEDIERKSFSRKGGADCQRVSCNVTVDVKISTDSITQSGRCAMQLEGLDDYCLRDEWEKIAAAPTVEAGRAQNRAIIDACGLVASKHSAGSFCPQYECDFSAGVSIDMVPGTAGECLQQKRETPVDLPSLRTEVL